VERKQNRSGEQKKWDSATQDKRGASIWCEREEFYFRQPFEEGKEIARLHGAREEGKNWSEG